VALVALLAVVLFIGSIVIQQAGDRIEFDSDAERLAEYDEHSGRLLIANLAGGLGFALFSVPLYFLFKAAAGRATQVRRAFVAFAFIGPILLGVQIVLLTIGLSEAGSDFVEQAPAVERQAEAPAGVPDEGGEDGDEEDDPREELADDLLDENDTTQVATGLLFPGLLGLVIGMVYIPLWAMRTGLMTRFWATLGMALGVSLVLLPFARLAVILWFIPLALLIADRWPGGRPPAWSEGRAVPWLRPGEEPSEADRRGVEGEGREVPPGGEDDQGPGAADRSEDSPQRLARGRRRRKRKRRGS
jgi:hypothetical protein